jgi:hypothetical protein
MVESTYQVTINAATPTVASSSHPMSTVWYQNSSPYLTWTLPNPDLHTTNFYWVLDRFASTIPTKQDTRIPLDPASPQSSKQLLLTSVANGISYFHLITEDTMGYLTRNAAHFRVQVGANPGTGTVSGVATDGHSSAFLSGVTVTLNRGIQSTSTSTGGAYSISAVYAQPYEVRASHAGYVDAVQQVTVAPNLTSVVNFVMTPQ